MDLSIYLIVLQMGSHVAGAGLELYVAKTPLASLAPASISPGGIPYTPGLAMPFLRQGLNTLLRLTLNSWAPSHYGLRCVRTSSVWLGDRQHRGLGNGAEMQSQAPYVPCAEEGFAVCSE